MDSLLPNPERERIQHHGKGDFIGGHMPMGLFVSDNVIARHDVCMGEGCGKEPAVGKFFKNLKT